MINFDVNLLFQLVNLCIILFFLFRILNKNILPDFQQQMDQENLHKDSLKQTIVELKDKQKVAQFAIEDQENLCKNLQAKVSLWQSKVEEDQVKQNQMHVDLQNKLEHNREYQSKQIAINQAEKQVSPIVHKALSDYAEDYFQNVVHQQKYIHDILNYLDKYR